MFVYLIIAIELTVIYFVFWIVFLREPRPREVRAELWGSYFKPDSRPANTIIQPEQQIIDAAQIDFYLPSIVPSISLYRASKIKRLRRKKNAARRSSRSRLYCQLCSTPRT